VRDISNHWGGRIPAGTTKLSFEAVRWLRASKSCYEKTSRHATKLNGNKAQPHCKAQINLLLIDECAPQSSLITGQFCGRFPVRCVILGTSASASALALAHPSSAPAHDMLGFSYRWQKPMPKDAFSRAIPATKISSTSSLNFVLLDSANYQSLPSPGQDHSHS